VGHAAGSAAKDAAMPLETVRYSLYGVPTCVLPQDINKDGYVDASITMLSDAADEGYMFFNLAMSDGPDQVIRVPNPNGSGWTDVAGRNRVGDRRAEIDGDGKVTERDADLFIALIMPNLKGDAESFVGDGLRCQCGLPPAPPPAVRGEFVTRGRKLVGERGEHRAAGKRDREMKEIVGIVPEAGTRPFCALGNTCCALGRAGAGSGV